MQGARQSDLRDWFQEGDRRRCLPFIYDESLPRFREYAVPARLSCGGLVAGVEPRERERERGREPARRVTGCAGRGDGRGMGGRSSAMQSFVNVILASLLFYNPPLYSTTLVAKLALFYGRCYPSHTR